MNSPVLGGQANIAALNTGIPKDEQSLDLLDWEDTLSLVERYIDYEYVPGSPEEKIRARDTFGRLESGERDVLGLINLGLTNQEIADRISYDHTTIRTNIIPLIFKKLGIDKQGNGRKRPDAMHIAWTGGLLLIAGNVEKVWSEEFPKTRMAIADNRLGENEIRIMSEHKLTINQLELANLLALGLTTSLIVAELSIPIRTAQDRIKALKIHVGQGDEEVGAANIKMLDWSHKSVSN